MRVLAAVLALLIVILQYPLWLGRGGWLRVWDLDRQVTAQKERNEKLRRRNAALDAEVQDLKQGFEAVEERARFDLGMVRQDEVFFQVIPQGAAGAAAPVAPGAPVLPTVPPAPTAPAVKAEPPPAPAAARKASEGGR